MFKSIQWKLVAMFVLIVISVMVVVGTFLINQVESFYHEDFQRQIENVFFREENSGGNLVKVMEEIVNKYKTDVENPPVKRLKSILYANSGQLGIDDYRKYYILDGGLGRVLDSSEDRVRDIERTNNIISALVGKIGNEVRFENRYMDFAIPLMDEGEVQYIIYVIDDKEELRRMMAEVLEILYQAVIFGLVISIVLGFFLSKTITKPIATLTSRAVKLASGEFEHKIEVQSEDEIGKLTDTFNYMAGELKHTLEEIAQEKNKVETILLYMTDGVMAFDFEGKVIHINPAARRMLNIDQVDHIRFNSFFKELNVDISLESLMYLEQWKTVEKTLDFNDTHVKAYFAAFNVEKDKFGGVIVVLQDVTEQQKLDNARREFVANVSHELRTPLTTIKSYAETLLQGALEDRETLEHFLHVINSESDRMTRLVKDLLTLSKLDHGKTALNKSKFLLKQLIEEVIDKLDISVKNYGHTLTFTATTDIPEIYADKDRIEQVLINILSNAIKYTPEGGKISVYSGKLYNDVYIKIVDNGIGIPKEDLPRLFERFYRVDKARSRERGGTGLGLAIAKEIITAHEGTISIESEQGKGTEVTIKLPINI